MSYDISLRDQETHEVAQLPSEHLMTGGTYQAEYIDGQFYKKPIREATLNVTYNYAPYYYETGHEDGIRSIYGKTGADSIKILEDMIEKIRKKYHDGMDWITTTRDEVEYISKVDGRVLDSTELLEWIFHPENEEPYERIEKKVQVHEGDTTDYWRATAANALRPLHQLLAMAKLRPDCVWDGD